MRIFASFCLLLSLAATAWSQETPAQKVPAPADAAVESPSVEPAKPPAKPEPVHVDKRLFGFLPNYRATPAQQDYMHASIGEKFKIAEQNTFDWPNYFTMAGFALQTQIAQKGWHQTGFGRNFAEYYARGFADSFIGNYTTEAVLPTLLHEDPRYFRLGSGNIWKRLYHASSQVVITRGVTGRNRLHLSELLGNAGVVAVTNLYYPGENHSLNSSAARWGLAIGNDAFANLLTEFLPDIERKLHFHH